MFKTIFLSLLLVTLNFSMAAQEKLTWQNFADVVFKPKYNDKYGIEFLVPTFGETIKTYQGKEITIKGYFLDISGNGSVFLLSENPMATCFFCGAAGPETIIEVNFKEKPNFKTDQIVTITGVLKLNKDDVEHCNYVLDNSTGELVFNN